jgi:hypothetical protein
MMKLSPVFLAAALLACGGPSQNRLLETEKGQLEARQIQSRMFETTDREKMLRNIMATLQDLGFVMDKADAALGVVTATKLDRYALRMTVTVRPRGEKHLLVRANGQFNNAAVLEPGPYQQFFSALSKAMFLEAQQVD